MTGLGVALCFAAGFFNIGAEGQFLLGALVASGAGAKMGWPVALVLLAEAARARCGL
jgi:simple sugar transport system permease protein